MPVYEYKCEECGKISEFLIQVSNIGNTLSCSFCNSHNLDRIISVPSLIKDNTNTKKPGQTCCGRTERCETPPCSSGKSCCHG
jgi:putative FmdB family regulatory protein